jgi:predicted flap endonuclease-1-like 5' DNA nuclease
MNESIATFLEGLDPFWHFLVPVLVAGFLGCLLGIIFSCMGCRPKSAAPATTSAPDSGELAALKTSLARAEAELVTLRQAAAQAAKPSAPVISPVMAAARPPAPIPPVAATSFAETSAGPLGLVYRVKPPETDDLTLITGLSPEIAAELQARGIYRFDQISRWTGAVVDAVSRAVPGANRIAEDQWIAQAKRLQQLKADGQA